MHHAAPGEIVHLELAELNVAGKALVTSVGEGSVDAGAGCVVTGTLTHDSQSLVRVRLEDESHLEVTSSHRLYSASRGEWVAAGELRSERLRTRAGTVGVSHVDYELPVAPVFNLEVFGSHRYFVGDADVLAHNTYVFRTRWHLVTHYAKHAHGVVARSRGRLSVSRFGADSSQFRSVREYASAASDFLSGPVKPGVLQHVRPNGDVLRFDPATGAFGALSGDGFIKTFFHPADGMAYWLKQIE